MTIKSFVGSYYHNRFLIRKGWRVSFDHSPAGISFKTYKGVINAVVDGLITVLLKDNTYKDFHVSQVFNLVQS